jgi:hypothetical protein
MVLQLDLLMKVLPIFYRNLQDQICWPLSEEINKLIADFVTFIKIYYYFVLKFITLYILYTISQHL